MEDLYNSIMTHLYSIDWNERRAEILVIHPDNIKTLRPHLDFRYADIGNDEQDVIIFNGLRVIRSLDVKPGKFIIA
jgi:hypothetical protein